MSGGRKRTRRRRLPSANHTNILKLALVAETPLPAADQTFVLPELGLAPDRPLVIVDVDEVVALFMQGFARFVARRGYEMRIERFALFQNIFRPGESASIDLATGRSLFDDFFRTEGEDMEPAPGAAEALAALSETAQVVILTNAPEHGRTGRARWLARHGMDYPLVINSGPKGPAVAALQRLTERPAAFVDDLLPTLDSAAIHAPAVRRFQIVADERLRPFAPAEPDRHAWHDDWGTLRQALERSILSSE